MNRYIGSGSSKLNNDTMSLVTSNRYSLDSAKVKPNDDLRTLKILDFQESRGGYLYGATNKTSSKTLSFSRHLTITIFQSNHIRLPHPLTTEFFCCFPKEVRSDAMFLHLLNLQFPENLNQDRSGPVTLDSRQIRT